MLLPVPRRKRVTLPRNALPQAQLPKNDSASARLADREVSTLQGDKYDPLFCVGYGSS